MKIHCNPSSTAYLWRRPLARDWVYSDTQLPGFVTCAEKPKSATIAGEVLDSELESEHPFIAWLGDAERVGIVRVYALHWIIEIESGLIFSVSRDGQTIELLSGDLNQNIVIEGLLGAALVFALAVQGIYCLHGSSVSHQDFNAVFLGESGAGKSTLAADISKIPNWHRLSDDITPVSFSQGECCLLPAFPQLKLPELENLKQASINTPARLYCLQRGKTLELNTMSRQDILKALVRHTAGARMFPPQMLAAHFNVMSDCASNMPVTQLLVPHSPNDTMAASVQVVARLLAEYSK